MSEMNRWMKENGIGPKDMCRIFGIGHERLKKLRNREKLPKYWTWALLGVHMELGQIPVIDDDGEIVDRVANILYIVER